MSNNYEEIRGSSDIDFRDEYGIKDTKIYSNREKIPKLEDCHRCRIKIALMDVGLGPDYFNMDCSLHECKINCYACGEEIQYLFPNIVWSVCTNLDGTVHQCRYFHSAISRCVQRNQPS